MNAVSADAPPAAREGGSAADVAGIGAAPSALRAAYEEESRRRTRRGAIAFCLIGVVVILVAIPLDHLRFPETAEVLLRMRLWTVAALGVVLALLLSPLGGRHPRVLALFPPCVAAALLFLLAWETVEKASTSLLSTNFVLIGVALLIPWPAAWSALVALLVLAGYVGYAALAGDSMVHGSFVDNLSMLTASGLLAIVATVVLERRRVREFAREWALAGAHRAARANAERYRSVVDTAGSAIIVLSPDGRIVEFNREAEHVLGWSRADAIGHDLLSFCVAPASREPVGRAVACALAVEPVRELEARLATAGGGERVLVCNTSRLSDGEGRPVGVIVCAQDITDRKRVEEALRESENRLRTVIAECPVVLFALDRAGVLTLSEGRGLDRLGIQPGALTGLHITEVVRRLVKDPTPYLQHFERALAGETATWVGTVDDATFECRLTPLHDPEGGITGAIGMAIDVTEREQAEKARLGLERTLLEAQKLESLGLLAGGVAHDFNNLLMMVLGNVSRTLDHVPRGAPIRENLERIEIAARRGAELTRQMLAYAGKSSIVLEPVDLNAIVDEMKDVLHVSIRPGVRVTWELARELPAIDADATQLRQMVMNLVINATEGVGERGAIAVRTAAVELGGEELQELRHAPDAAPGPHVCLEVVDTGCGMDAATMAKIFDPFFTTKPTGQGLGLATVLGVVRAHHGALGVESEPGRGTTFRVLLPARVAADDAEGRTVLLVDDEADVRAVTAHMLERLGCSVLQARDGREGVEVFRAHAQLIDAVILDLSLPRLSGQGVFREIRGIRPDARVILMSGYSEETATRRLGEVGLAGFLRKPFSVADLRSTMGRALTVP